MIQKAIIDTTTRVIKRITIDDNPQVLDNEMAIVMAQPIDLSGGFKKLDLDNQTLLIPTQDEIDQSGVDDLRNDFLFQQKQVELVKSLDDALADPSVPQSVKDFLNNFKNFNGS